MLTVSGVWKSVEAACGSCFQEASARCDSARRGTLYACRLMTSSIRTAGVKRWYPDFFMISTSPFILQCEFYSFYEILYAINAFPWPRWWTHDKCRFLSFVLLLMIQLVTRAVQIKMIILMHHMFRITVRLNIIRARHECL